MEVRLATASGANLTDVDCVVCRQDAGVESVRAVAKRRPAVPLVYCTPEPDGQAASAATRAGADEYVPLSSGRLDQRVEWILEEASGAGSPTESASIRAALEEFSTITVDSERTFEAKLSPVLDLGREFLDVSVAYLTSNSGDGLRVLSAEDPAGEIRPGLVYDDEGAIHRETLTSDGLVTVEDASGTAGEVDGDESGTAGEVDRDASSTGDEGDGVESAPGLACYVGGRVGSGGDPLGTLCFGCREPRDRPFDETDLAFVELLVDWVGYELEHELDRETLNGLLSATVELMTATDRERIAKLVATAAADVLGFPINTVRLVSADDERLEPVAVTGDAREVIGERPTYAVEDDVAVARAFRSGSPVVDRDVGDELGLDALEAGLYLPLGDNGSLSIATTAADAFTSDDRTRANILAANGSAALDRTAREESLRRFRAVHETVREMVYVTDGDGRLQLVTPALADRVGRDRGALESASTADLFGEDAATVAAAVDALPPDADEAAAREDGFQDGTDATNPEMDGSRTVKVTVPTADGGEFPAEVELAPLPDGPGCVGVVRDMTELRRARDALESERERFASLFEQSPDPVADAVIREGEPHVRRVNEAFEETFGYDEMELIGERLNEYIVPPERSADARRLDEETREGKMNYHEVERLAADGRRTFLFRGVPYAETETGTRTFRIYTDVTDQRDRERRLQVLHRVLRHNIRNDVTSIQGYATMLSEELDGAEAEWADRIAGSVTDLSELSEDVQGIERTLQRDPADRQEARLVDVVNEVVGAFRDRYPAVTFSIEVADGLAVSGRELVRSAVSNLVENGIEHNDRDEPTVRIGAQRDDGRFDTVLVAVSDDGPGIPERERAVLSDETPITQLDHSRGLGLWLSRWIAESLGGDLRFDPSGEGSTVVLELPLADE